MPCAPQLLCATATPAVHGCARTRCRRHDAMQGVKNQRDVSIRRRRSALVVGGGESALWQKTGLAATLVAPEVAAQRTITSESAFAKNSGGGAISRASSHADLNHLPTCRPRGADHDQASRGKSRGECRRRQHGDAASAGPPYALSCSNQSRPYMPLSRRTIRGTTKCQRGGGR